MRTDREALYGNAIWTASRNDEGTISVTGANVVARAVLAVADAEQAELRAEIERLRRGAQTLGKIIDDQCRMVLDATGLHDLVDEDGDGDWGAIWDRLFELRAKTA